ncbi:hypothetical protein RDWZM_002155 [Blomia tropicalis]|uniref:Uncharacterized protein n=1 Tax=Blomia tropicalis TaxID=40697 RepID=A0A9Q0MHF0_BLOTA|nr:hypothetical protein RDWZM_002155 [Blomia tropicalis]
MIGSNQLSSFPLITSSSVVTIASMLPATITTITDQSIMNNNNNNNNRSIDWLPKHLNALNQSLETMGLIDTTTINDQELIGTEIGSNDATSRLWFNHGSDLTLVIGSAVDNGSNCDRSNRSSLQSCTSSNGSGHGTKRNSSNLYINNPNSLEVETAAACLSPDGNVHRGSYHYANYDYGHESGGGGGGGGIPGMAQLVIHNPRVINSSQDAIPRSVSVPLSRSNSRKESTSTNQTQYDGGGGYLGIEPVRSQLTRNLATYYETQRKKNAKTENVANIIADHYQHQYHQHEKQFASKLNDLSLNMEIGTNVITTGGNNDSQCNPSAIGQQWIVLDNNHQPIGQLDIETVPNGHSAEYFHTRSLPWSQSIRSCTNRFGESANDETSDSFRSNSNTTTIGRVPFTKRRRNRMRNDSAAAIAFNRSGLLGGSLDWDVVTDSIDGDVQHDSIVSCELGKSSSSKPTSFSAKLNGTTTTTTTTTTLTSTLTTINPNVDGSNNSKNGVNINHPSAKKMDNTSNDPDSPDYLVANEAIVVYNERTAL